MARTVVWSVPALEDLEAIAEFIGRDSESYAKALVEEVWAAAISLGEFAERGRVVPEIGDASCRELFVRKYRLIYDIIGGEVVILTVVHGARDLPKHLGERSH